ncbi:MAG TPA: tetratricopeptide repeat protein [Acidimicrobiales bacterium]|nr:tetratricopeptide repeat protein [Acidimicrobiales bacterium]
MESSLGECAAVQGGGSRLLTRFVGREADAHELVGILGCARLVTLVGAPGCGKTRLALELADRLPDRYPGGVRFVELAPVGDGCLVASAVAASLGIDDRPLRSADDALVEELSHQRLLLVLDNCEHVVGPVAALVTRLLDGCPGLQVLATSRAALGLTGEQVWRVPPLDLDPAVELFIDRAGLSAQGAGLDPSNALAIREICRRLDGLPLAIELAAAWSRVLTPTEILDRMDPALALLRSRARDASPRQRTMEATLDWSYQLLQPAEQLLFEQLSVFAGGFDFDAAQGLRPDDDVLDGLASLVDSSLVLAQPTRGKMRYRLLEPVRQCAESWLVARGLLNVTRRRHAEHYLSVARRLEAGLRSAEAGAVLAQLDEENDNLRVALRWARDQADDLGLRLCTALAPAWAIRGRTNEGRGWLDEMLRRRVDTGDLGLRASGLARASRLAWRQRDYASARALLDESLAIERRLDDPLGVARRLRGLALVAMAQGELDEAQRLGEESVSLFRRHGDRYGLGLALAFLGLTLQLGGDPDRAHPCVREALELNRSNGSITSSLYSIGSMAFGAIAAGDIPGLRAHVTEIIGLLRQLADNYEDPGWLWWTGVALASGEGRHRTALRLAGAAESVARRDGLQLHEQLRRQVQPWLDRALAAVGSAEADQLGAEGSQLSSDQLMVEALHEVDRDRNGPLSAREQEIADLVARGLTNREIAQCLIISTRTVESHVEHIKAKLGFARRARIVAWALDRTGDNGVSHNGASDPRNPGNHR